MSASLSTKQPENGCKPETYEKITIEGVRKSTSDRVSTVVLSLREGDPLTSLWNQLTEQGFDPPASIKSGGKSYQKNSTALFPHAYKEIKVVSGVSGADEINIDEPLIKHSNDYYGEPVQFVMDEQNSDDPKRPTKFITDGRGFEVSFQKTPRMPDDDKLHQLPGSLGAYDLFNVEAYADRLPKKITEAGGAFLPMWQREALWIDFESRKERSSQNVKYAVRVFVGKVNAVSGLLMDEQSPEGEEKHQDYVIIPGQEWLDGICVAPGVVRQFVAMPLGSGYTIEGQKTREETHGGLQIEVIPEYQQNLRCWCKDIEPVSVNGTYSGHNVADPNTHLTETRTPRELGLQVGDILRSYPIELYYLSAMTIGRLRDVNADAVWMAAYPPLPPSYNPSGGFKSFRQRILNRSSKSMGVEDLCMGYPTKTDYPPSKTYDLAWIDSIDIEKGFNQWKDEGYQSSMAGLAQLKEDEDSEDHALYMPSLSDLRLRMDTLEPQETKPIQVNKFEPKNLKSMGLAAGGKLIQDIYTDRNPASIWNHSASRLIYVHILSPASFEQVTHIVPQSPSLDVKAYAEAGGQFFVVEEDVEGRIEGGEFEDIKSVSAINKQILAGKGKGRKEEEFDPMMARMCKGCEIRLCDCIIRPCNHTFCNVCIQCISTSSTSSSTRSCPTCSHPITHVAGFSAPMNLPGEEPMRMKVPVHVLKIEDGRVAFKSISRGRV